MLKAMTIVVMEIASKAIPCELDAMFIALVMSVVPKLDMTAWLT